MCFKRPLLKRSKIPAARREDCRGWGVPRASARGTSHARGSRVGCHGKRRRRSPPHRGPTGGRRPPVCFQMEMSACGGRIVRKARRPPVPCAATPAAAAARPHRGTAPLRRARVQVRGSACRGAPSPSAGVRGTPSGSPRHVVGRGSPSLRAAGSFCRTTSSFNASTIFSAAQQRGILCQTTPDVPRFIGRTEARRARRPIFPADDGACRTRASQRKPQQQQQQQQQSGER